MDWRTASKFEGKGRWIGRGAVLWALASLPVGGCSKTEDLGPPKCTGVVLADGSCHKKCDPSACLPDHDCVANECRPKCTNEADCIAGFNCVDVSIDDTADHGPHCYELPYTAGRTRLGRTEPCSTSDRMAPDGCDEPRGYACVAGNCAQVCALQDDCADGACVTSSTGVAGCQKDDLPRAPGQYGTHCPYKNECDATASFSCISSQGAEGDPTNYCTKEGCAANTDCPTGYYCNLDLTKPTCLRTDYCRPCETNDDCSGLPDQICATDAGGEKICTQLCDENLTNNCPWGAASICAKTDPEVGVATCSHKTQKCKGTGAPCQPCSANSECGSNGLCIELLGTRERACVDLDGTCAVDSDCPTTPNGGLQMACANADIGYTAANALYHHCIPPNTLFDLSGGVKYGCWQP